MVQVTTTGTLIIDETTGNTESDVDFLDLSSDFRTYLTNQSMLNGIIEEAKGLTITVLPEGSTVGSLVFSKADGTPFSTTVGTQVFDTNSGLPMKTIGGEAVYLYATGDSDVVVAKDASGDLVAVFYLNDEAGDLSASIEMVSYQALEHHDATKGGGETTDQDLLDWGDQLSVTASGSLEFNFNNLASGKFTWVAVGTSDVGMLVTGSRLNIADDGTRAGSGKTASDAVNTSQGGDGATIGIDNQMFTPGDSAIFTLVREFGPLPETEGDATGQSVDQILHDGYYNTNTAELFVSQRQGNDMLDISMSIFTAGKNGDDEDADGGLGGAYAPDGAVITGNGKNAVVEKSTSFTDDAMVNITTVDVYNDGVHVGTWTTVIGNVDHTNKIYFDNFEIAGGIKVDIDGHNAVIHNVDAGYSIKVNSGVNTFNRIELGSLNGTFDIGKFLIEQGVGDTAVIGDLIKTDDDRPLLDGDFVTKNIDEDELDTGNTDNDAELVSATYSHADLLTILTAGIDTPIHFSLDTSVSGYVYDTAATPNIVKSKGENVVWADNNGVIEGRSEDSDRLVFEIVHDAKGTADPTDDTFTVTLKDQVDHGGAGDEENLTVNISPAFDATDDDLDPALNLGTSSAVRVVIENDVPIAGTPAAPKNVMEDALTGGNLDNDAVAEGQAETTSATFSQSDLSGVATVGADEELVMSLVGGTALADLIGDPVRDTSGTALTSAGQAVVWAGGVGGTGIRGVTIVGGVTTTIFTLAQNANATPGDPTDDSFTFTLVDQLDHDGTENDEDDIRVDITPAFAARDFDGDAAALAAGGISVNVENDLPVFAGQIASNTLDWVDNNSVTSSLRGQVGADAPAHYVIDKYTDLVGYDENLSLDGQTLTYASGGKTYFTLQLDDSANAGAGGYTFTVNETPPPRAIEFNFDNLASGNFLWVAVAGTNAEGVVGETGLMVTGSRLNLNDDGTGVSGGKLASDQVNTSQGGAGATIGIDNQMFTPGDSGIFTFVKNFVPLVGSDGDATGQDIDQIVHAGYTDVGAASLFISQKQGNTKLDLTMSCYEAGSGAGDEDADGIGGGPYASGGNISGSGKTAVLNKSLDFLNDTAIALDSVEIRNGSGALVGIWTKDFVLADFDLTDNIFREGTTGAENIMVDIRVDGRTGNTVENSADINGVDAFYSIKLVAEEGDTFNRIELSADKGKFDIGKFVLDEGQDTPDLDLAFSVAIEDKDGDLINYNGTNDVFDDFKIKVDGTGQFDGANTAPAGFSTSYDTVGTLTSLALKDPGFVDDSGMTLSMYSSGSLAPTGYDYFVM